MTTVETRKERSAMNSAVSTAVRTALPVVTSAATAYVMRRTRLPGIATPVVSLVIGGAVAKLAQRIR
ncbi:hypothetical protein MB27_24740 [Actinoplanes utahensis]|uniref:Uncharacterized protein n=1 Tax=Actinoplanes utahensis TaxID=1869 RepID=A0A0A6UJ69_ACTUT|nr:hypothetical protein MB27_24740 [Actinoplanes utahensis]